MSQQFLLPCTCGQKLPVSTAQAGGQVTCSCGKTLSVPTLRGLRELEVAPATLPRPAKAGWSPVHGFIFATGLVLAAVGVVFLALNGLQYSQIMGFGLTRDYTDDVVRAELARIDESKPLQLLEEWKENIEHGLGEQEEPPWSKFQRQIKFNLSRIKFGAIALGAGLLLSFATLLAAPKSRSSAG